MHHSYQQLDIIVDLASDGSRGNVGEGTGAVKFAGVVKYAEVVRYAELVKSAELVEYPEFVKFTKAGKLPEAVELVEADGLVRYVTLGEKEVLMLGAELEVGQMGMREPLRELKEVVLEATGCDWAVGSTVIGELGCDDGNVEDVAYSKSYGHSDAAEHMGQPNWTVFSRRKPLPLTVHSFQCHLSGVVWHRSSVHTIHNAFGVAPKSCIPLIEVSIIPNQRSVRGNSKYTVQGLHRV